AEAVAVGVGVQLARDLAEPLPLRPELADLAPEPGEGVLLVHRLGDALEDGAADDGPRRHPRPGLGHRAGPLAAQAAEAAGAAALHTGPEAFAGTLPGGGEPALGVAQAARRVAGELLRELLPGLAAGLPCGVGGPAERGPQRGLLAAHLLLDVAAEPAPELRRRLGHHVVGHLRSEEHTSELQSREHLVCRLLHERKNGAQD